MAFRPGSGGGGARSSAEEVLALEMRLMPPRCAGPPPLAAGAKGLQASILCTTIVGNVGCKLAPKLSSGCCSRIGSIWKPRSGCMCAQ